MKDDFITHTEWAIDADVIFANATCFEPHMVSSISKTMVEHLRAGTVVIITTKTLEYEDG